MTVVTFKPVDDAEWCVSFPYDANVVQVLKDTVPSSYRRYVPATKRWFVSLLWADRLRDALIEDGHTAINSQPTSPVTPPPEPGSFFEVDEKYATTKAAEILDDIPSIYHGQVFRAMAKQLYPDLYGIKS